MRVISVLMLVVSCLAVGNCAGESRKIDEVQYKNHRTSSNRSDTLHKTYPVYPAQVYANLSNIRDSHPSKTTEMPTDEVRMFFTASSTVDKRRPLQDAAANTTPVPGAGSVFRTATPPSTYIVTARNVIGSSANAKDSNKSPIYSVPNRSWTEVKNVAQDFRGAPTVDESKSKTKFNDTKIRRVLKAQNQVAKAAQLQSPLRVTTVNAMQVSPPSFAGNQWNSTSFAVNGKTNATGLSSSSKPFATVMVPKHVLDGGVVLHQQKQQVLQQQQHVVQRDDSFHPIAAPVFTPYKSSNGVAVDTNNIVETNRRVSSSDAKTLQQSPTHRAAAAATFSKVTKYGYTKPLTYKVEEYVPGDPQPSVHRGIDNEQHRLDQLSAVITSKRETERLQNYVSAPRNDGTAAKRVGEPFTYGFADQAPPAVKEPFNGDGGGPMQFREFYQATEWPATVKHEKYNPYDSRAPQSEFAAPSKEYTNGPVTRTRYPEPESDGPVTRTRYPEPESDGPEFTIGEQNPKEVLKNLLRDMLKSKQPSESKPRAPTTATDDIIDSYFTANRQNVESTLQDIYYDIQSDMNCNLRSSKYITDGQCMSTKPVVEVVCADRCLVAANLFSHRHRSSSLDNQQVEALHCVDGDVKMVRVQLKCRDGNMFHNVIKVVTNCRCKLHPVQPQMRSNTPRSNTPRSRTRETISPEIMAIASGHF